MLDENGHLIFFSKHPYSGNPVYAHDRKDNSLSVILNIPKYLILIMNTEIIYDSY